MNLRKIGVFVALFLPYVVFAQEFSIKSPDDKAKVYKDWASKCDTNKEMNEEICYVSQTVILKNKDVEILNIAVASIPKSDKPLLRVITPLNTLLPEGITINIDDGDKSKLPFIFCNRIGCYVEMVVNDKFINGVKRGNRLNVKFLDPGGRSIEVPVSLSGFSKAYASLAK